MDVQSVYDAYMTSNGIRISDFKGGTARVSVPYELKAGQKPAGLTVWYIADDGVKSRMDASYSAGEISWTVSHFSNYIIVYDDSVCPKDESCPISAFSDASPTAWYHDGVHWALENGVMQGFGGGIFKPNGAISRAQMAQILWNLEGKPEANATLDFTDVVDGAWYVPSLRWANSVGVIIGYANGKIGPNDTMTREQLVTVIYRYAAMKGNAKVPEESTLEYSDAYEISSWAAEAFRWAVQADIVKGDEAKRLAPRGTATRAEIATIMMRYCENTAK
jgi:hypothetical protein